MHRAVHITRGWLAAWLSLVLLVACGGAPESTPSPASDTLVLQSLHVTPGSANLPQGLTVQMSVSGHLSDGSVVDLSSVAVWASSDTAVAAVGSGGTLAGVGAGTATVTATVSSLSAQAGVEVTSPELLALEVEPPRQALAAGLTTDFRAYGRYTDGSRREVTAAVAWSSAAPLLAEASGTRAGRVTALAAGSTTINASLAGASATTALTVTDATLVGLEISPASAQLAMGTALALQATGLYSDNTWADVSAQVSWQSTDSAVVTVDDAGGVNGVSQGPVTVTAGLGGFSATAEMTVTDAALLALDIAPRNANVAVGSHVELTATGRFSDGSRQEVSGAVLWSSSDETVATLGTGATVEALAPGVVQLAADLAGVHAATSLTVKARELAAIQVTPVEPTLALGGTLALGARGDFDDGSSQALAGQVTWESRDPRLAVVDGDGVVTPVAPGTARISASQGGVTGSVALIVTGATLETIDVLLDSTTLAAGTHARLAAVGHYSDGTTQDLTGQVHWSSSDRDVAVIQSGTGAEVRAWAPGSATLSVRFGAVEGQQTLTVSAAELVSLDISPSAASVVKGGGLALSALGHYSDGSQQDVTGQVVWASADLAIATVSNASEEAGGVSGVASGSVALSATLDAVSAAATLTVLDDPQAPQSLTVLAAPDVILADGVDTTTLTVAVLATGPGAVVADGTTIHYQIRQGDALLAAGSSVTSNGQANVNLQASTAGLIVVEAAVAGTGIVNDATIVAVDDFATVLAVATPFSGTVTSDAVRDGARFGLFVFNLSNREFNLDRFRFYSGGVMGIDSDDPVRLNQNRLPGAASVGAVVVLDGDFPRQDFAGEFLLSDPASGRNFSVEGTYPFSE